MTQPTFLASLLALVTLTAAAPAAAEIAETEWLSEDVALADGSPDARLWKEPCALDGKGQGELLRVSGSAAGANMSQGRETWRVQLGADALVELTQEGRLMIGPGATIDERERWSVACSRGAVRIRAGDAELLLAVAGGAASVDAKWLAGLSPVYSTPSPRSRRSRGSKRRPPASGSSSPSGPSRPGRPTGPSRRCSRRRPRASRPSPGGGGRSGSGSTPPA